MLQLQSWCSFTETSFNLHDPQNIELKANWKLILFNAFTFQEKQKHPWVSHSAT